jgi:probable HAF family extracellular repeat protein
VRTHAFLWDNGAIVDLGAPGGFSSGARGINDKTHIVGAYSVSGGGFVGFLWEDGVMSDLPMLTGYDFSVPNDINVHGQIVGFGRLSTRDRAVIWIDGQIWNLNHLVLGESKWVLETAAQINDQGQIVSQGINPAGASHAYLLTPVPEPATILLVAVAGSWLLAFGRSDWAPKQ